MKTKMIITALFATLSFTSCVNFMSKQNVPQQVKNLDNEKVIKQSFALKDFHAISNAIGIDVYYTQSAAYSVSVEGTEQCIAQAKLEVTDGVLNIMNRYAYFYNTGSGYNAMTRDPEFTYDFLEEFQDRIYYGTDICMARDIDNPMQITDSLRINNYGSLDINNDMNIAGSVHINNNGSFDVDKMMHITGSAFINNYGSFDGSFGLKGRDFEVSNYGSFDSHLTADCDHIKVNSFGSTDMDITGTTKQISINDKGVTDIDTTQLKVLK